MHSGIEHSISSRKVIEKVQMAINEYRKPKGIRTDYGTEFTSKIFQVWIENQSTNLVKIKMRKLQWNAFVQRFNRSCREDILDANLYFSLENAVQKTVDWIQKYKNKSPNGAINNLTPKEYVE